jgi:hypothetical protein
VFPLFQWDEKASQLITSDSRHGMKNWTHRQKDACPNSFPHSVPSICRHRMIGSNADNLQHKRECVMCVQLSRCKRWDGAGIVICLPLGMVGWTRLCSCIQYQLIFRHWGWINDHCLTGCRSLLSYWRLNTSCWFTNFLKLSFSLLRLAEHYLLDKCEVLFAELQKFKLINTYYLIVRTCAVLLQSWKKADIEVWAI